MNIGMVGYAPLGAADLLESSGAALTHPTGAAAPTKKPGAVSRPGAIRQFQFRE
jgi:hypothetical protein